MFKVTKAILTGPLRGLTVVERTAVCFEAGKVYGLRGTKYRVLQVERVGG